VKQAPQPSVIVRTAESISIPTNPFPSIPMPISHPTETAEPVAAPPMGGFTAVSSTVKKKKKKVKEPSSGEPVAAVDGKTDDSNLVAPTSAHEKTEEEMPVVDDDPLLHVSVANEEPLPTVDSAQPRKSLAQVKQVPQREEPRLRKIRKQGNPILDAMARNRDFDLFHALDKSGDDNLLFTWLSQFAILTEGKRARFLKVFNFFDEDHDHQLSPDEVCS
jgi:hypothetical protein